MPDTAKFGGIERSNQIDGALQPNTILLARYKITAVLGGGGQGAVYQARDLNFPEARRLVAVKEMHVSSSEASLRASTIKTFQREANILATLSHPAIPRIYDFFDQTDRAYIVMEYINGNDLEDILIKTKKLPMDKIIEWAIDLCDVLHYLHSYQPEPIIFRDMKPANIMIDSLGKVRLVDFGIAKIFASGVKQTMIGTEGYSAPEQYKGNANPLSDQYSLGATLHHVITRKDPRLEPPFSFSERPIHQFNPEAPQTLTPIIEKALSFEPNSRYRSCAEMKEHLEQLRYRPISLGNAPSSAAPGMGPTPAAPVMGGMVAPAPMPMPAMPIGEGHTEFIRPEDSVTGGIQPRWKFKTEDEIRGGVSTFETIALVGSYDTNIWALNMQEGKFLWKYATVGGIATTPIVDEWTRLVLVGSEDSTFYGLDLKDGKVVWSYPTTDRIRSTAAVAHGQVFFGSDDGKLYALVANAGRYLWSYDTASPIRTRPCIVGDYIIIGNEAGEILGLELNGHRKWAFRAKQAVSSSPYVDIEGICYVGSFDGYLYAIDAENGYSHWRVRTNGPIISSPTVERNLVYIGSADGKLYCINTQTGRERWQFATSKPIVASPVIHEGAVYFGGTDNILYCLDAKSGKEIWKYQTSGAITSAVCITNDLILFGSLDKTLYALPLVTY